MDVQKSDRVKGKFGVGLVTDVAHGYLTTQSGLRIGPDDDMVRIMQYRGDKPVFKYIYRSDIEEIL